MGEFLSDAVIRHLVCAGERVRHRKRRRGTGSPAAQAPPFRAVHTTLGGAQPTKAAVTRVWESLMRGSLTGTPDAAEALVE
ncbi:hypothetical protein GCM10010303_83840 [Streptomyces purpurascens]|nr:hypothetical protein GCM10010303_83840 [Streptomyces purpurascens]